MIDVKGVIEGGKLRILAIPTEQRLKEYPDIPTTVELGYPGVKLASWYGIAAPAGVTKEVSEKLKDTVYKTIKHPEVQKMLLQSGSTPVFKDAEEFAKFVSEEEKKIQRIAKEANIRIE